LGQLNVVQAKFVVFEIDLNVLLAHQNLVKKYSKISSYPLVKRDLAFLLDKKYTWQKISSIIIKINSLIKEVELFDVFDCSGYKKGDKLKEKRSLAFHVVYQSMERTLEAKEIDKIQKEIIKVLEDKFGAQLRNF